jgi:Na+-driven multidrug efflux pump
LFPKIGTKVPRQLGGWRGILSTWTRKEVAIVKSVITRVIVSVSILLLLLVGISFVVGGTWIWHYSEGEEDIPMAFAMFVYGGVAVLIGSPLCVGAGCLAAWLKPWRSQPSYREDSTQSSSHSGQRGKSSIMKRVLASVCYLVGFLLGCISIIILGLVGLSAYDGGELDWGLTAVWFLVPIFSVLSFIAARRLWRSDED